MGMNITFNTPKFQRLWGNDVSVFKKSDKMWEE